MKQSPWFVALSMLSGVLGGLAWTPAPAAGQTARPTPMVRPITRPSPPPQSYRFNPALAKATPRPAMSNQSLSKPKLPASATYRAPTGNAKPYSRPPGILTNYPAIMFEPPMPALFPALELAPSYRPLYPNVR